MIRVVAVPVAALVLTGPAAAQHDAMHGMHGMAMPEEPPAAKPPARKSRGPARARRVDSVRVPHAVGHAGHANMSSPRAPEASPADPAPDAHPAMRAVGTALPAGDAPPPAPPDDHYADRQFPPAAMQRARGRMMRESGGQSLYLVMVNLAEYRAGRGRDGYRWDGEAWFGGDIDRLTFKTEGGGALRGAIGNAEVQALYSRAIGPYFNLQAGVRHDREPGRPTTYATAGFEGLAPYWFQVEGAAFLSDRGDLLARLEGYYDQRITQRIVLQPRVELNLAAQNVPRARTGAGLASAELGLRLRYEITRSFAPYVGVAYEGRVGRTARYARADGDDPRSTGFVAGVRLWF